MLRRVVTHLTVLACGLAAGQATAHPHIWVAAETTVLYENGSIVGLRNRWTFDEFYSAMAARDLDANNDGKLERSELAELAKVNIESLKEFGYFTFPKLAGQPLMLDPPRDYFLEHIEVTSAPGPTPVEVTDPAQGKAAKPPSPKQQGTGFWDKLTQALTGSEPERTKVLALEFTVPLQQPVLAEAPDFTIQIADPAFFIWFDLVKEKGIRLTGAPHGCRAEVAKPTGEAAALSNLSEQLYTQLGSSGAGFGVSPTVSIVCPRS